MDVTYGHTPTRQPDETETAAFQSRFRAFETTPDKGLDPHKTPPVAPEPRREHDALVIGEAVMPTTPTMLPTMRYDPDREVVLIWPQDGGQPYLVTRTAIERRIGRRWLSPDELIDACEEPPPSSNQRQCR